MSRTARSRADAGFSFRRYPCSALTFPDIAACACLINPHFVQGIVFPLALMGTSSLANIGEWQPTDFSHLQPVELAIAAALYVILTRWVKDGAPYAAHWAYVKPVRPPVPVVRNPQPAVRNPIDAFVFARLEKEGLTPSPEADRYTLVRRVALDLTGLPPMVA